MVANYKFYLYINSWTNLSKELRKAGLLGRFDYSKNIKNKELRTMTGSQGRRGETAMKKQCLWTRNSPCNDITVQLNADLQGKCFRRLLECLREDNKANIAIIMYSHTEKEN
jgi:hypothetical protein